eukprot:7806629-Alexandrium_andersonii.AAC.1
MAGRNAEQGPRRQRCAPTAWSRATNSISVVLHHAAMLRHSSNDQRSWPLVRRRRFLGWSGG